MKKVIISLLILSTLLFITSVSAEITHYSYEIINTYPHDEEAFTQGLEYENGYLFEGTGLRGESSLRRIELKTGEIKQIHKLDDKYFGEGITIFADKIYQLTWQSKTGFIYDLDFKQLAEFDYPGEGWGLTNNNKYLIMSDGTSKLYFLDPESQTKEKEITVTLDNEPVNNINELEYIKGKIFANIWQEDHLIIIEPRTGKVTGIVDLADIINPENYNHNLNVLNGIAYDEENDRLFVTGKLWPLIFEIDIKPE
ncbi:MAG: glutaminyl-peptide cyclotransferase [bacterium]